jgi:hypothetical protein
MPTISVTNLTASALTLPGNYYTETVPAGGTVSFSLPDTDKFSGLPAVIDLVDRGIISLEGATDDVNLQPIPTYTTVQLGGAVPATGFPSGTLVWDTTLQMLAASVNDVWRCQTTVISGTTAALGVLVGLGNVPLNAVAFCTDLDVGLGVQPTLVHYNGTAFVSCRLSIASTNGAGVPAGILGQLTYDTTRQALLACTTAPGTWDTLFVPPVGTTALPPDEAATVTGGIYFNTNTNRLSFRVGAAWVHLPVTSYAIAAALETIRTVPAVVNTAGQFGWSSDLNRLSVYPGGVGAAWVNDTTVGMYAPAGHEFDGAIVMDPTGFGATAPNGGALRVYHTAGAPGWVLSTTVVPVYPQLADLPTAGDLPDGTLALVNAGVGVPGHTLYCVMAGVWAHEM